ncbi:MAG: rRNA maturation RNase YbeY [Bacillota bacterium]|nr:rRNA maturation RNase YbeY [Thermoanaerobacteraceae bacterium]
MAVIVQNLQEEIAVTERIESAARQAAEHVLAVLSPAGEVELGITFVDDAAIRDLNRRYRSKDRAADVLSFPMGEEEPLENGTRVLLLGDVVISLPTAARQAEADLAAEVARLVVHGVLHLLGYDHEREEDAVRMRAREEEILQRLGGASSGG